MNTRSSCVKYQILVLLDESILMAKNTSIILGDHFDAFIRSEIASGRYASASEIIRSGLRLLEEEKRKMEAINAALVTGELSGTPQPFDSEEFKKRMRKAAGKG